MYARKQLLIWTAVIFVLNLVLLTKLRDDAATARTQLEELTPNRTHTNRPHKFIGIKYCCL